MPSQPVQQWHIYFVRNFPHTTPPKDKLVIVACFAETPMIFLINSTITEWLRKRPHLLVCDPVIRAAEHDCLRYDSYVHCQTIFPIEVALLTHDRGPISTTAREDILNAVQDCPVLERRYKNLILGTG